MELDQLLDIAIKKAYEDIKINIDQGLNEAEKIIDKKYSSLLDQSIIKINDLISKKKEQIEGEKAKLDIENKRSILNEENYWINKVYEEVNKKIFVITQSDEYINGIKEIIKREAKENSKILCSKQDFDKIKGILKELKMNINIETDENLIGGIKINYPDVGLTKDYSLNLILNQVFEAEKPKVAKILFGE
ncbi:hypothetical protein DFR86_08660 [Acidianus sulfidivorans JP7]|uniref:Uncharacterized protein n=1 Tax=Acidianus sulfidivorans JP7 TaxID=619593 RepID=A0A2U9INN0_9CREN|nr:V-type ATP synthase subunit E [Acidianus sulfidivorans]AWR97611.1 hypothetical protein DFR86_08660 [Acidianus sulfidivorans JP7]